MATQPEALSPEYEIETLLGSGRSGTTYLARALGSAGLLTVKILVSRDERDIEDIAGALRPDLIRFAHPGVARTHAVDLDAEGNLRIVRDYIRGRPLASWAETAAAAARQQAFDAIAAAVDAVHAGGLVHGNIAAANVIVAAGGRPMLVDLGAHLALRAIQGAGQSPHFSRDADRAGLEALRTILSASP
ncbi:MAG: hypothetical protein WD690_02190 [Vicinamibacterales bacterium]